MKLCYWQIQGMRLIGTQVVEECECGRNSLGDVCEE